MTFPLCAAPSRWAAAAAPAIACAAACALMAPSSSLACACGCGIFDVGTGSMLPSAGSMIFLEYDYMDQNRNWHGTGSAPAADNSDKEIETHFITIGLQYMVDRDWTLGVTVPYWERRFRTTDDTGGLVEFDHGNFGDVRLKATYTGFSDDMSTGITAGVKLPSGDWTYQGFDRDTSIGTGSTDLLLGAYHEGRLSEDSNFSWFSQIEWDQPLAVQGGYRPGAEIDAAAGAYYSGWTIGSGITVAPVLQLLAAQRQHDMGVNANSPSSGYSRVFVSPGIEFDAESWRVYGDVEVPVFQWMRGDQLVAPVAFKAIVSYSF